MNDAQEEELRYLIDQHGKLLDNKYRAGAAKHKGDLADMMPLELLENALDENLDQYVYIMKAILKLEAGK